MADWKNKLYFGDNLEHPQGARPGRERRSRLPRPALQLQRHLQHPVQGGKRRGLRRARCTPSATPGDWSMESEYAYRDVVTNGPKSLADLLQAMRSFLGQNDMMAYLTMMAQRMVELRRVLKPTGSIYLHCDPTASHYLKLLMDSVFGPRNFRNEITWQRTESHNTAGKVPLPPVAQLWECSRHPLVLCEIRRAGLEPWLSQVSRWRTSIRRAAIESIPQRR